MGFLPEYYACIEAQDSAYHLIKKIEKVLTEHSGYVRAEEGSLEYIAEKPLLIHQSMPLLRISIQQGEERVWAHFFFSFSQSNKTHFWTCFALCAIFFLFLSIEVLPSGSWMAIPALLVPIGFMIYAYGLFTVMQKYACNRIMQDMSYYLNIPYPKAVRLNKFRYWLQRKWNRRKTEKGSQ